MIDDISRVILLTSPMIMSDEQPVVLKKIKKNIVVDKDANGALFSTIEMSWKKSWSLYRSKFFHNLTICRCSSNTWEYCTVSWWYLQAPHFNSEIHGSHKWCYRQFTNISRMLKRKHLTGEQTQESTAASRSSTRCPQKEKSGLLLPQKSCLFCGKGRKKQGSSIDGLA